ncbi:synergin gamma isoform X2 [Latimeria chalumnae]|uniref:synergin gamma isoform X2 n=1 Tax=Latimeria chalumnae TaxID=7897 RepID=UPI00313D7AB4
MALRPGTGGGGSFMFPVARGLGPPQGIMPMQQQQQGFPMVPVMQPNMQGMMGMNFGSQIPPGTMPMQGGMPMGPMTAAGMPYMGQPSFMGMRPPGPQYTADMQKQFAEEQQKRFEQQQRIMEEDRKRRQFEEQKQKLRLFSSVKPKMGEKSRDDALEAIKGNLDGFSREAKMQPGSHPKKPDFSTPVHSAVCSSHPSALPDDEEFSDFMQGPAEIPSLGTSAHFQPFHPNVQAGLVPSEQAVAPARSISPARPPVSPLVHRTVGQVAVTTTALVATQNKGPSLEEKLLASCDLSASKQSQVKFKTSLPLAEMGPRVLALPQFQPSTKARNWSAVNEHLSGIFASESPKAPEPKSPIEESGVGVFPAQDSIQPLMPAWIYNDNLVPDVYKKILGTTMTPAGIDTAKLYPILMSSGLPRETLGQIWALTNRTTPGKLTKEELYTVLAMIAIMQRGIPTLSLDALNQFAAAPVPSLAGVPMALPSTMSQQPMMSVPSAPTVSISLNMGQPVMGMNMTAPLGGATAQSSSGFMPSFTANQTVKPEDDDFQDFQEAPKPGSVDDSFTDFQGDSSGTFPKIIGAPSQSSTSTLVTLIPGSKVSSSSDKYAVFKELTSDKPPENSSSFSDNGDKYSVFRTLEQPTESKTLGDNFADFKSDGTDDGFTDFKTADSISPLEPSEQEKPFTASFPSLPILQQQQQQQLTQPSKNPLNLAELQLFSSLAPAGENKAASFSSAPLALSGSASLPASSSSSSSGVNSTARKNTALVDDFADFSLFGADSSAASGGGQDDFADFMGFGNAAGFPEQKDEDKYSIFKQETSGGITTNALAGSGESVQQPLTTAADKYNVFKQISLEGSGLGFEESKDTALSSVKNDDDFADFQSTKFSVPFSNPDKALVDKVAAFKHAKEDSASVKSLDLPSIGGSSVGKEDSEDALSVQFDMKLADVGGDLKHVMSDSSLDLPPVSNQHPPVADMDDLKIHPFGTHSSGSAVGSLTSFDWSEKDETVVQGKKQPSFFLNSESRSSSATSILQKKETSFGSSENVTMTTVTKVTTFSAEDAATESKFAAFADFKEPVAHTSERRASAVDFGDFASSALGKEKMLVAESGWDGAQLGTNANGLSSEELKESANNFGEFHREKSKISKFDFLVASSQGKMKSSEEMIRSELETFDLSVQGSHKRSLSLGDKEITRSSPLPASEQPFRDRSNTLSEKTALPIIRDKYKDLTGEVEESERYAYEWQRCLESALRVIKKANDTLNGISSSSVCTEVIQSAQGMEYLLGVVEVYRVAKRVELGIKATAVCSEKLQQLLKDVNTVWSNLMGFMSLASLSPDESSLDFSSCMLRPGIKNARELACGICLLNVDSRSKAFNSESDNYKLAYGGHQYHASCANFWINCVEPKPPGLILPDLL